MRSIFIKLAAVFLSILIIFSIILSSVFLWFYREQTIDNAKDQLDKKAVLIAESMGTYLQNENDQAETMHQNKGEEKGGQGSGYGAYIRNLEGLAMADVWIVDTSGQLITTHQGEHSNSTPLTVEGSQLIDDLLNGKAIDFETQQEDDTMLEIYSGSLIYLEDGTTAGAVLLHAPVEGIQSAIRQGTTVLLIGVLAALCLGLLLSLLLAYWITRPLRKMEQAAVQMSDGSYTVRTGVKRHDEIGRLARAIDILAEGLEKARKEREALDRMKNDFVANVSHELRTPVAVLRGSVEQLKEGVITEGEEVQTYYTAMFDEACHLEHMVNDLLDLSKLQSDAFELTMDDLLFQDVLDDALRFIRPVSRERAITFQTDCEENHCIIDGDYQRIRQLLLILLDNAVKFSNPGGTVGIRLWCETAEVHFEITNTGETIDPEELPYIFDRFKKSGSRKNAKGTGLGLPIARQIVLRHHGKIEAESQAGATTFKVCFPIKETGMA